MLDIYEKDWRNGVAAPFFEYAFSSFSYWMDISYSYKDSIWEDNGKIVAFCFYENPVTDIYFSLKPGYEELAPEMIAYADEHMPRKDGKNQLILFGEQTALINAAKELGYRQVYELNDMQFDFEDALDYTLPEGFHFVKPEEYDIDKISKCCWKVAAVISLTLLHASSVISAFPYIKLRRQTIRCPIIRSFRIGVHGF